MKNTIIAAAMLGFALTAHATTDADLQASFNPYQKGFPTFPGLSAGTVINKGNVDQFKEVVPDGVYKLLKDGLFEIKVGPTGQVGDDHRRGERRGHFEAVELRVVGALAPAVQSTQERARILIGARSVAGAKKLGCGSAQVGQKDGDQHAPVGEGHGSSAVRQGVRSLGRPRAGRP